MVLEHLLLLAPEVGTRLIGRLTGGFMVVAPADALTIEIRPQVETGQGRPDLEIATPHQLVWMEVKAESELRAGQLEGYRVLLAETGFEQTRLVLLTRYPESFAAGAARPDLEIRWFEWADWLAEEVATLEAVGEPALFLVRQYLDFLRIRGMTLTQVGKYMPEGIRALQHFLNMLFEAAAACKVTAKRMAGWEFIGVRLDEGKSWVGIFYANPEKLCFATRCRIDPEAAVRLGVGELKEESWVPGRNRWWRDIELDSEEVHFFARTKVNQMRWLEGFLRECLDMARRIEVPGDPAPAQEEDGTDDVSETGIPPR